MKRFPAALILSLVSIFLAASLHAQETKEVRKSGPLSADGRVSVDTYKGSISVTGWDKPEFEISALVEADDERGRDAAEKVQDTEIRIDASSSSVRIKTDYDKVNRRHHSFWDLFDGNSGNLPLVHYTIKMPRTAQLVIKDYKSKTNVSDLRADVEIETYKGRVEVNDLDGGLMLETYKGEVWADFAKLARRSRFETYKGEIQIKVPKGQGMDVDADIGRRARFDSDFDIAERYRSRHREDYDFRTSVNGGGPLLRLKTDKGTIRLLER
jgi:hypothetical protein